MTRASATLTDVPAAPTGLGARKPADGAGRWSLSGAPQRLRRPGPPNHPGQRSEPQPRVRDFARILDHFDGRDYLAAAFFAGYGRPLTSAEEAHLAAAAALDSVSGISFGTRSGDPELVERGRRILARLRAGTTWPYARPGGSS